MNSVPFPRPENCPYRTGDRVRCINNHGNGHDMGLVVGQIYTIGIHFERWFSNWRFSVRENEDRWFHDSRCFEPTNEPATFQHMTSLVASISKSRPKRRKK